MTEEEMIKKSLKELANNIFSKLDDVEKSYLLMVNNDKNKQINDLQQELQRKDNNWNELKKYVNKLYEDETYHSIGEVLDKIEELYEKGE